MLAFGAILPTLHKTHMIDLVFSSLELILKFLNNTEYPSTLKETTSWVLMRISKFYGEIFESNKIIFENLINNIFYILPNSKRKIICLLINTIHYFVKNLRTENNQLENCFSKFTKSALENLLDLAFKKDAYDSQDNIAAEAMYCIGGIIQYSTLNQGGVINEFFETLKRAFESTFELENFKSEKIRSDYQGYISHCIFSCVSSGHILMEENSAKILTNMIIMSFKQRNGIYEEGLLTISAIALNVGSYFEPILKESFGNYLVYALKSTSEVSLCKNAIICTCEIIRALGENFIIYIDQIIPIIFEILSVC